MESYGQWGLGRRAICQEGKPASEQNLIATRCDRRRDPVLRGFGLVRHRQPPWMGLPDALRVPRFLSLNRAHNTPSPNFLA